MGLLLIMYALAVVITVVKHNFGMFDANSWPSTAWVYITTCLKALKTWVIEWMDKVTDGITLKSSRVNGSRPMHYRRRLFYPTQATGIAMAAIHPMFIML